jgi:uncharacterized protein YndB with AHSA1/START domain
MPTDRAPQDTLPTPDDTPPSDDTPPPDDTPPSDDGAFGTIHRELQIDASPEVVFEVISRPEHVRAWWPDEFDIEPVPGATGRIVFGEAGSPDAHIEALTVVEVDPPHRYAFRWTQPIGEAATGSNSLLVTFDLTPMGDGTLLRMTESGFREQGWEVAQLEAMYLDHCAGWDHHLARLLSHATTVAPRA